MKALIIIACVIGYLIMWVVTGVIAIREAEEPKELAHFLGAFWPVSLPILGMKILIDYTDWFLDKREEKK